MDGRGDFRIGFFGDVRREQTGAEVFERVVATGSLVVRKIAGDRRESCRRIEFWDRDR